MKSSRGPWLAIALFATVPVFIVDLLTPSVVMIGLLQFVPILIATQTRSIDAVRLACGVGISLLILGGLLSSIDYPIVYVIANRLISLVGIVVVASWGVHVVKRDTSLRIELEESRGLCDRLEGKQEFFSKQRRALMSIMEDLQLEVSQRKQLEKSLRKTQFVVDHAHDVVLFVEYDGRLSYANEQARNLFGYQADTQMRIDPGDIDVTSADDDWPVYWDAIISMGDRIYNTKHRSKEGNVIECQARSSMLHFEGESLLVLFIRDVSDVKRAEAFRASLFERSTNPHLIFGDGGIIDCNHAATTILGFEDKQSLLKHHPAEFSPLHQPDGRRSDEKCIEMDEIARRDGYHRFEWLHQSVGKEEIPCDVTLTPVQYQNGNALLVVWQDLRERKMAEAELLDREERLRQANISMVATQQQMRNYTEELEYANQELEEFAYIASHDLRSPLRGIGQLSRFIREDDAPNLSEESQQNLDRLEGRVDRMQKLLDDLLCYSRIGQSDPELEEIDVGFLISETIELLSVAPHFEIAVQEPLPALVSYPTPLRMVFLNLIGNAVKHHNGPTGSISVGCKALESCYQFTVADDGPGIDSAYHTKIFKMFQTLESRDKVEASGMGLAIIQKTLLRFGGEITVESELGSGSSFHFTWPKTHEQHR